VRPFGAQAPEQTNYAAAGLAPFEVLARSNLWVKALAMQATT
jgi:hypothetical protein